MAKWKSQQLSKNVFEVITPLRRNLDWEFWALFLSDIHFDSTKCDRELLKQHLEEAVSRGAAICIQGDLIDGMQGKLDPRSSKYELRAKYLRPNYLDAIISDTAEFLEPFAKKGNIILLGDGNHETAIRKNHEICPMSRLIGILTHTTKKPIFHGHYSGYVKFSFEEKGRNKGKPVRYTVLHNYHHGSGLKSKAAMHRRAATHPDVDIFTYGHHHDFWCDFLCRFRLSPYGKISKRNQLHLGIPGYKDDLKEEAGGWAVEKGHLPKPLGSWWVKFTYSRVRDAVVFEPQTAK